MPIDWRRQVLRLPALGDLSVQAVRAAYWRLIATASGVERERIRDAKQQLLFELGVRVPDAGKKRRL